MKKFKLFLIMLIAVLSYQTYAGYQVDVYNNVDKSLWLYFDVASVTNGNFTKGTYKQPWGDGTLTIDKPYTISFDAIETAAIWFIIADKDSTDKYINANPPTSLPSDGMKWVGGFFECTAKSGQQSFFDLTNIDQIGLLCGMKQGNLIWGYNGTAIEFIDGIMGPDYCNITGDNKAKAYGTFTCDTVTYQKLLGPPQANKAYENSAVSYLTALNTNKTQVTIKSDTTKDNPPQHQGTEFASQFTFTGLFGDSTVPAGSGLKSEDIVLTLTAKDCPSPGETTTVCYTKTALNGGTIMGGDSDGGVYIKPGFEYVENPNPNIKSPVKGGNGKTILKRSGWVKGLKDAGVNLNWSSNVKPAVWNTTGFMTMISSVGRDLVTALNLGYIGVTPVKKAFVYGDESSYAIDSTQKKYINQWNRYITGHSNAYGMSYSDNAHAKVLYHPTPGTPIECHIFGQNDPKTKNYYSSAIPPPAASGNYSLGIGANSDFGTIICDSVTFAQTSSKAYGGKFQSPKGWRKLQFSKPEGMYIWIKLEGNGSIVGEECIVGGASFQKSNELNCLTMGGGSKWKDGTAPPAKPDSGASDI